MRCGSRGSGTPARNQFRGRGQRAPDAAFLLDHPLTRRAKCGIEGRDRVPHIEAIEAAVGRFAQSGVHADVRSYAADRERIDAARAELRLEIGAAKGAVCRLVDDELARRRLQRIDEVMAVFAANQEPPERPARTDLRAGAARARELLRSAIGKSGA